MNFLIGFFIILILAYASLLIVRKHPIKKAVIVNLITSLIVCIICVFSFKKNSTNYIDIAYFYILLGSAVPLVIWFFYKYKQNKE